MAAFLRKYNTATAAGTHIRMPVIKAGAQDYALSADWTPAAGDVKLSKDSGAEANITTLPAFTNGAWEFQLTGAELTCKTLIIKVVDAATKAVEDQFVIVETFGNASAMYPVDYSDAVRFGLTALPNVASGSAGSLVTSGTGTSQLSTSAGLVTLAGVTHTNAVIPTVTTLTNLPSIPANWLTAAGIAAGALNGKGDWLLSSSYTTPPTPAAIATGVWQDTTAGDFAVASSIGKSLFTSGAAPGSVSGLATVADICKHLGYRKVWYVRTDGNDTTGDGSQSAPFLTVRKAAQTNAIAGDLIHVGLGDFTLTTLVLQDGVTLEGSGWGTRILTTTSAALNAPNIGVRSNATLRNFHLKWNTTGGTGTSLLVGLDVNFIDPDDATNTPPSVLMLDNVWLEGDSDVFDYGPHQTVFHKRCRFESRWDITVVDPGTLADLLDYEDCELVSSGDSTVNFGGLPQNATAFMPSATVIRARRCTVDLRGGTTYVRGVTGGVNTEFDLTNVRIYTAGNVGVGANVHDIYNAAGGVIKVHDVLYDPAKVSGTAPTLGNTRINQANQIGTNAIQDVQATRAAKIDNLDSTITGIPAAVNTSLAIAHGSGDWSATGSGGGTGTGDVTVNHNYGATDAYRVLDHSSNPVDGAVVYAYDAATYATSTALTPDAQTFTGSDGRWTAPLHLDAGSYKLVFSKPGSIVDKVVDLVVV
jgi:hypothetical protein